ncbi:GrpB family protein [Candidatus Woesearchaeota archaeon]|jgi:GrpB-like predicted nucleotidyltransferase (UPF0157 family)|nr:GrpB family protein [Candidatus Woesearchaeota archaeon]MBT6735240.1 GrpB family protein [Candidatus Woesearchaeota archaeon]MBT7169539.1 GrpB family protein [Candidatus Woesearchaeota archaeon]MBT7474655.1 GrpB family protein [Candidatus Woesearchaeota archaeon]
MADLKKYSFNKHSEKYKQLFNREKAKLKKIFPRAKIEHVGSSSINGLGGKGIIDVAISVPKNQIQNAIEKLERNGYNFRPNGGDKERSFFQKIIKYKGNERRVHIQLTHSNSKSWKSMLAVRDYLRKNPEAIKEYERVKKEAIKHAKGEGKRYREYKKSFLQKIEKLALKEYSK